MMNILHLNLRKLQAGERKRMVEGGGMRRIGGRGEEMIGDVE